MMREKLKRGAAALVLALAAGAGGYLVASGVGTGGAAAAITAPGTTRVFYSLDAKKNDQELIALINAAKTRVYFAIYEFTLTDVADALVAAKGRGVDVRGLVDSTESTSSHDAPVMRELGAAGIPVATERHADGKGIMHIKALATDSAYAIGSYNWTRSATVENDEVLEIGTDPALVATYEKLLARIIAQYAQ